MISKLGVLVNMAKMHKIRMESNILTCGFVIEYFRFRRIYEIKQEY